MFEGVIEFLTVAKLQSFSKAAQELQVSNAHVSRCVKRLEEALDTRLLSRSTRSVQLTLAGQRYFDRCHDIVSAMQEANDELSDTQTSLEGTIKIAAGGDYAENTIAPLIDAFARAHPDVSIVIDFNSNNLSLLENNFDFAIRYGELKDSADIAIKLTQRALRFACSVKYLSQYGEPKHPSELIQHRCITSSRRPWQYLETQTGETRSISVRSIWQSNNGRVLVNNAINGNGIIYLPQDTIAFYDKQQSLQTILADYARPTVPSWIVMPQRKYVPLRVRRLVEFIRDGCAID